MSRRALSAERQLQVSQRWRRRQSQRPEQASWRQTAYDVIFEADTPAGRAFDIALLIAVLSSVLVIAVETVPDYRSNPLMMRRLLYAEWFFTALFTVEYGFRVLCTRRPLRYVFSFWGVVDLLSILPTYLSLLVGPHSRSFMIIRSIRLLRVFRVLKLWRMMSDAEELSTAVWRVRNKIVVFLAVVLVAITISSTLMYHLEADIPAGSRPDSDFTSIPQAMYWGIVTMATVGYGDIVPKTTPGKVVAAGLILLGYSLIIVPSGFVTAELSYQRQQRGDRDIRGCSVCGATSNHADARFCDQCGSRLPDDPADG